MINYSVYSQSNAIQLFMLFLIFIAVLLRGQK